MLRTKLVGDIASGSYPKNGRLIGLIELSERFAVKKTMDQVAINIVVFHIEGTGAMAFIGSGGGGIA